MHSYLRYWRKHGSKLIFILSVLGLIFNNLALIIMSLIMMLTIPCGIMLINKISVLWNFRQALIVVMIILLLKN